MNGNVNFAYVNGKYFDDTKSKARLNVLCSNSVGKDQYKKYISYSVTLWEDEAVYWNDIITGKKDDKQCVSFSGYISDVTSKEKEGKTYTTVQVALSKAGKGSCFFLLPNLSEKPTSSSSAGKGVLSDDDF